MLEDTVGASEIAWDEGRVAMAAIVPPDAPVRLAQERPDIGGNGANWARSRYIMQGHARTSKLLFGIKGLEPLQDVLLTQVAHGLDIAARDPQDFVGGIGGLRNARFA